MKKLVRMSVALMLFTVALNGAVWAQSFDHKVRAEVPFSFYAGNKLLPAGSYTFGFNVGNHSLMIVNNHNADGALLIGSPDDAALDAASVLIFRTDGEGVYALETLKASGFALDFHGDKTLARLATNHAPSRTTVTATP